MQNKGSYGDHRKRSGRCATTRAETPSIINNQRLNRCSFLDASVEYSVKQEESGGRVEDEWKTGGRRRKTRRGCATKSTKPYIEAQSCFPAEFPRGTKSLSVASNYLTAH